MKLLLHIIMACLLITTVTAITAGTSQTIHTFDKCDDLKVFVTAEKNISENEYNLQNCEQIENNTWSCECNNNFNLILSTQLNTINSYNFTMEYKYKKDSSTPTSSGGGSNIGNNPYKTTTLFETQNDSGNTTNDDNIEEPKTTTQKPIENTEKISEPDDTFINESLDKTINIFQNQNQTTSNFSTTKLRNLGIIFIIFALIIFFVVRSLI